MIGGAISPPNLPSEVMVNDEPPRSSFWLLPARAARDGKSQKEDLGGSSFTITSLGKLGGLLAPPIINYPEVGILGIHAIKKRPVVRGDQIVIGEIMNLSFSFDHRIIDGDVGANFAQDIISYLQEPDRLVVEMA